MAWRTAYLSHDAEYERRRALGYTGWDTLESLQQTIALMDGFLADIELPPHASMLELGCGAGDLMLHWAAKGYRAFGVDISPYAVKWARDKAITARVAMDCYIGDVTQKLDLPISPVDLMIDGHCLHCIIGKDREQFFQNAATYLKPSGILHVNTMCGDPKHPQGKTHYDSDARCIVLNGIATRFFGRPEIILAEMEDAGFHVIRYQLIPAQYEGDEDCLLVNASKR